MAKSVHVQEKLTGLDKNKNNDSESGIGLEVFPFLCFSDIVTST